MGERIYDALDIAKYIINKCTNDKCPITNLQLQKILYFLQKEYLVKHHKCLFENEIQAWQFGPVVSDVYYQFCGFGSSVIDINYNIDLDNDDIKNIDLIVKDKREKDPWDLVSETHAPKKAWDIIYKNGEGNRKIIPIELIKTKG